MSRYAIFRSPVHFIGTNLNLERRTGGTYEGGMQRLIHISLRHRHIVLESAGNGLIHLVYYPQGCITILDAVYDYTDSEQVIKLIQGLVLIHHLLID